MMKYSKFAYIEKKKKYTNNKCYNINSTNATAPNTH